MREAQIVKGKAKFRKPSRSVPSTWAMKDNRIYAFTKVLAPGLIVTALACFWLFTVIDDAWQELMLMRYGETCSGYIVDTWEDVEESDAGQLIRYSGGTYTYQLPDGREFTQNMSGSGRLKPEFEVMSAPYPIEVEYLPDNPTVSRIKGDGPDTIPSWLRSEVASEMFFPLPLFALGVYLLWKEVNELRQQGKQDNQSLSDVAS